MPAPSAKGAAVPEGTRVPGYVQMGPGDGPRPRYRPGVRPSERAPDTGRAKQLGALILTDRGPAPRQPEAAPGHREPMDNGTMTGQVVAATVKLMRGGPGKTTMIGGMEAGGVIRHGRRTLQKILHRGGRKQDQRSLGGGAWRRPKKKQDG